MRVRNNQRVVRRCVGHQDTIPNAIGSPTVFHDNGQRDPHPIGPHFARFFVAMAYDDLRFLLIELGEFRPRSMVDPQELIELGMQRQIVAPVGSLDKKRHHKYREGSNRIPVEVGAVEYQPQQSVNDDEKEGGRMSRRLPDMRRPMSFRLIHRSFSSGSRPSQDDASAWVGFCRPNPSGRHCRRPWRSARTAIPRPCAR